MHLPIQLNKIFEQAVQKLYADVVVSADFQPLFDMSRGDFGSSLCYKIADKTRQAADEIAHKVVAFVTAEEAKKDALCSAISVSSLEGFIYVRMLPEAFSPDGKLKEPIVTSTWDSFSQIKFAHQSYLICLPAASAFPSTFCFVRVLCAAWLQLALFRTLGVSVKFLLAGKLLEDLAAASADQQIASQKTCLLAETNSLRQLLQLSQQSSQNIEVRSQGDEVNTAANVSKVDFESEVQALSRGLSCMSGSSVFVWAYPDLAWSKPFRLFGLEALKQSQSYMLKTFAPVWFQNVPDEFNYEALMSLSDRDLLATALYLAGPEQSSDLDMEIPLRAGQASLLNYLSLVWERFERISGKVGPESFGQCAQTPVVNALLAIERDLFIRVSYLPQLLKIALETGQVADFVSALRHMLDLFTRLNNEPGFRARVEAKKMSELEIKITAGISHILSDMVQMCY